MKEFEDQCSPRDFGVDGIADLKWITADNGAWEGPKSDWANSHKEKFTKHCKNFRSVVTAGGNQGMYPFLLSQIFQAVYTFEPDPLNFHCLVNNCQKPNIIKINAALGSEHKFIDLHRPSAENTGMHSIATDRTGMIPMLRIDDFDFTDLDLIQLDIEGYEINAILGARDTILRNRPVIACERGNDVILQYLQELNYKVADISMADTIYIPNE